jgi:hypothetical protein
MGIGPRSLKFLAHAKKQGVCFGKTVMLGRQSMHLPHTGFAEPLFKTLGATQVDSLDVSGYEGANIIHDLNLPVPASLMANYDVVFDGGTLEHVFNAPLALSHATAMVKPGGYYLAENPANNFMGHGFYQFSPEFFWRALTCLGFEVKEVLVSQVTLFGSRWYATKPPEACQEWPVIVGPHVLLVHVLAQRKTAPPAPSIYPQQGAQWSMPKNMARLRPLGLWLYRVAPRLAALAEGVHSRLVPDFRLGRNSGYKRIYL